MLKFLREICKESLEANASNYDDAIVHKDYKAPPKAVKVQVRKTIPPSSTDIIVAKPTDPMTLVIIHRVVEKVLINGADFEDVLIEKEFRNPSFAFLINLKVYLLWLSIAY